uniref:Putative methionine biosynthesis protein n=1 Tax=viral metagenome TaxID=1070528 RepID=A0A6H1ZPM8_9ZZZZ
MSQILPGHTDHSEMIEQSIADAAKSGLFLRAEARPPVKLAPNAPKIAVCIPMGDKDDPDLFVCTKCGHRHFGVVKCGQCGEVHSARQKLRAAGLAPIEFMLTMTSLVPPLLSSMVFMVRKSVLSAQARNEMTFDAIRMGCKYIFYWDDDTLIPPKAIYDIHNMMERTPDAGVITGVYTTREECPEPLVYKGHGLGAYWDFSMKPGVLEEVWAAGAGCMMARVEALVDVQRVLGGPWWSDEHEIPEDGEITGNRIVWGHDIRFCKRMWDTNQTFGKPGGSSNAWKVYLAGWIHCAHFDIARQQIFQLPADSPPMRGNLNTTAYWDYIYSSENPNQRQYHEIFSAIEEVIPENAHVADVGCGTGVLLDRLIKTRRAYAYGYDKSPVAINNVHMRLIQGEVADVKDLKLNHFPAKDTYLVSTETIEHLTDEEIDNLLKQASKCKMALISTPNGVLAGTPAGEHVQVFTPQSLRKRLKAHFKYIQIKKLEPQHMLAVCSNTRRSKK